VDVIPNRNQIRNFHISKIRFLFPVSFSIEYNTLLSFFCVCDLVLICCKMWSPELENCQNRHQHTSKIVKLLRFVSQTIGVEANTLNCFKDRILYG